MPPPHKVLSRIVLAVVLAVGAAPAAAQTQSTDRIEAGEGGDPIAVFEQNSPARAEPLLRAMLDANRRSFGAADPRTVIVLPLLGFTLDRLNRHDEAAVLLAQFLAAPAEARLATGVGDLAAATALGGALIAAGKPGEAEKAIAAQLAAEPGGEDDHEGFALRHTLAQAQLAGGKADAAAATLADLLATRTPPNAQAAKDARTDLARSLHEAKRYAEEVPVRAGLADAADADRQTTLVERINARIVLAEALDAAGDKVAAANAYADALARIDKAGMGADDAVIDLLVKAGNASLAAGQKDQALRQIERLSQMQAAKGRTGPNREAVLEAQANLLSGEGRTKEAAAILDQLGQLVQARTGSASDETIRIALSRGLFHLRAEDPLAAGEAIKPVLAAATASLPAGDGRLFALRLTLAEAYRRSNAYAEAEGVLIPLLADSREIFGDSDAQTAQIAAQLAQVFLSEQRIEQARPLLLSALEPVERKYGAESSEAGEIVEGLARLADASGDHEESGIQFRRLIAIRTKISGSDSLDVLAARNNYATALSGQGRLAEAEEQMGLALAAARATTPQLVPLLTYALAGLQCKAARYVECEKSATEAAQSSTEEMVPDELLQAYASTIATARLHQPDKVASAVGIMRIAVGAARQKRLPDAADRFRQIEEERGIRSDRADFRLFADAAWSAAQAGKEPDALRDESFGTLQESLLSSADRELAMMAARRKADAASAGLGQLAQDREVLLKQWQDLTGRIADTAANPLAGGLMAQLVAERMNVETRLDDLEDQLDARFPDYFALIRPRPVAPAEAMKLLGPDEALVMAVPSSFGTHVMVVTASSITWHRADWDETRIDDAVQRLRWDLGASVAVPEATFEQWDAAARARRLPKFDRSLAHALYQQLFDPVRPALADKKRLYIVPGGSLAGLPFSVLVTKAPAASDDDPEALRATSWLAFERELIHLPSVQALALLREDGGEGSPFPAVLLGVGNPVLQGVAEDRGPGRGTRQNVVVAKQQGAIASGRTTMIDQSILWRMGSLPGTSVELERMREALLAPASSLMLGAAAQEKTLRSKDLTGYRTMVFATHGLTDRESGSLAQAGLVMTPPVTPNEEDDGYLSAAEVASLRLRADWVVLSACNTASGSADDGLSGLARAFFFAGASNLLASHWPVDDRVASKLTVRTVQGNDLGMDKAAAFQRAMRETMLDRRDDQVGKSWAHPYYWAPFVLMGAALP